MTWLGVVDLHESFALWLWLLPIYVVKGLQLLYPMINSNKENFQCLLTGFSDNIGSKVMYAKAFPNSSEETSWEKLDVL